MLEGSRKTKYIFVTGGVVSSLGKGITAASLGRLLKSRGISVTIQKLDPYLNVDPGTMNPYQHGEVFVTDDGAETDLDLGHYERFIDVHLGQENNVTTGVIYSTIIAKERRGDFLGGTVQVVPHVTNEIKDRIRAVTRHRHFDVVICEVGGTVGDIESLPFLEAIRQFRKEVGHGNYVNVHVTLVPFLETTKEFKTKPTQHSVKELRNVGIQPEIIVCRSRDPLTPDLKEKISNFCDVEKNAVIGLPDIPSIYEVPLALAGEGLDKVVAQYLNLPEASTDLTEWRQMVDNFFHPTHTVQIAIVGKYVGLSDSYLSVVEALRHGGIAHKTGIRIKWLDSEKLESLPDLEPIFRDVQGIVVPGGFGYRGIEGKIRAIQFARENQIPFLGLCLGLQTAVIEFARHVAGFDGANSTEFDPKTPYPVVSLLSEQEGVKDMGGTMRLGAYPCRVGEGTLLETCYATREFRERHRHRYEVNNKYLAQLESKGLCASGKYAESNLVEVIEIPNHPWFLATQFHPEFTSRPNRPGPLFKGFVKAAAMRLEEQAELFRSKGNEEGSLVSQRESIHI